MAVPRRGVPRRGELALVAVLLSAWLLGWTDLTLAARLSGGHPTLSPLQLLDPVRLAARCRADGGHLVWWHLIGVEGGVRPGLFWAAATAGLALILGAGLGARALTAGAARGGGAPAILPRGLRPSSRWASRSDLRRLRSRRSRPGCLVVGARGGSLITTEPETSVLVVGPTRSGKTTSLVIPNLLEWRGPAIVTSTKSELVDITAGHRQRRGPVYVYDPTGEIGDRYPGVTWSPLARCDTLDRAWTMASWLCAALQQGGARTDNDWSHWAESGKLLIAPLLYCAASHPGLSIVDVRGWVQGFDLESPMSLLQEMAVDAEDPDGDPLRAMGMLTAIDQRPEKERGTVFSTVTRLFSVFNERAVAASALTSRFSPEELCESGGTLYLCTPRQAPERVASLFVGILMTVVTHAYGLADRMPRGRLQPELGLFLDELANVVPIEELPSVASQGAGRGVILMSIVQDLSQLRQRYGTERSNSVLNNHGAKLFLPGIGDPETCDLVARMVGRGDVTDVSLSDQNGRTHRSFSVRRDQMASPEALRQLPEGTAVLLYRGRPATLVRLRPWFRRRRYREMAANHYFRPALQVRVMATSVARRRRAHP